MFAAGGTDNHMIMWDLRPHDVTGSKFELICDLAHMTLNKNSVPGDRSALTPGMSLLLLARTPQPTL